MELPHALGQRCRTRLQNVGGFDLVQVLVKDGAVTAALRVPAGLDEGINRGP